MELRGNYLLPCDRPTAWAALDDPGLLKACLKGCEALSREDDGSYRGTVAAKIGPVAARFSGKMHRSEVDAPRSCRMNFEGQGGVAGFARGSALVTLDEEDGGTRLGYTADTQIGGKLAQIGSRLIEASARSMADDFFSRFAENLKEGRDTGPAGPGTPVDPAKSVVGQGNGTKKFVIIILSVALLIVLAILWRR